MAKQAYMNQSGDPCIELIQGASGPIWEVSGNGLVSRHQQLWQAMLRFDCMCIAKGLPLWQKYSGEP
jgi:hypothetical protein